MKCAFVSIALIVATVTCNVAVAAELLPQVVALHLNVQAPAANVPHQCAVFSGIWDAQFQPGPEINLVITDIRFDSGQCVFAGEYAWSAYGSMLPGKTELGSGPGQWKIHLEGTDLILGDIYAYAGMLIHADLAATYYVRGKPTAKGQFQRMP